MFHELDGFRGCFALVQQGPEVLSSWDGSEFLASELLETAAAQQDVRYRLASFLAWAIVVRDIRHSSAEEETPEANLLRAHLHEHSTPSSDLAATPCQT